MFPYPIVFSPSVFRALMPISLPFRNQQFPEHCLGAYPFLQIEKSLSESPDGYSKGANEAGHKQRRGCRQFISLLTNPLITKGTVQES